MRSLLTVFIVLTLVSLSCKKKSIDKAEQEIRFVPGEILVQIKKDVPISQVFNLINAQNLKPSYINRGVYTSSLPADSLDYVLKYLKFKPYTSDGAQSNVSGYVHALSDEILLSVNLYHMENVDNQTDWIKSMEMVKLRQHTDRGGGFLLLQVPMGEEKAFAEKLRKEVIVEWAEVNHYPDIRPF